MFNKINLRKKSKVISNKMSHGSSSKGGINLKDQETHIQDEETLWMISSVVVWMLWTYVITLLTKEMMNMNSFSSLDDTIHNKHNNRYSMISSDLLIWHLCLMMSLSNRCLNPFLISTHTNSESTIIKISEVACQEEDQLNNNSNSQDHKLKQDKEVVLDSSIWSSRIHNKGVTCLLTTSSPN